MGQEIRRGGHAFDVHEGLAAPFMFNNVSTDVIGAGPDQPDRGAGRAPRRSRVQSGRDGVRQHPLPRGRFAEAGLRLQPGGVPDRLDHGRRQELRHRSSRVTGVTRPLAAWGVRVYIGESFGPIFLTNAVQYGVLTVELPRETLNEIVEWVESHHGVRMRVDLQRQLIEMPGQRSDPVRDRPQSAEQAAERLHDLEEIEPHLPAARAMRERDVEERPWIYRPGDDRR